MAEGDTASSEAETLRRELAEARSEVARLRGLLGLDAVAPAETASAEAWEPALFSIDDPLPVVDESSPNVEKLALFAELFCGRRDVYAQRWENASSGKSGWSPAVRDRFRRADRPADYLAFTDEVIVRHLRGEIHAGLYPLMDGDRCRLLACDFDGDGWALDSRAYLAACAEHGVPASLEVSRSGRGGHVWVFFSDVVSAATARTIGAGLVRSAMAKRVEIDLGSYDRLFPSQDFVPRGSFGNLIALPLQGRCRRQDATVFVDPATMSPWPDQWAFLSGVSRVTGEASEALARALGSFELGPSPTSWARWQREVMPPLPERVAAELGGQLSLSRTGLPAALVAELKHLASLHNPEFYERQRMRLSTWATPRVVRCYDEDLDRLHLPRGLFERVMARFNELGSTLDVADVRDDPPLVDLRFHGSLDAVQSKAVAAAADHELAVVVAPPGAGKTVIGCALIAHHNVPALVLCNRRELIDQWRHQLAALIDRPLADIGQIGGGKQHRTGVVDVASIQSIARRDEPADSFAGYGLVVVDECHHLPAVSFAKAVKEAPVRRWLGLTATPERRDGLHGIVELLCGPIRHEVHVNSTPSAILRRELVVHETTSDPTPGEDRAPFHEVARGVADDPERTAMIATDVADAANAGRRSVVLTQRTAHIDRLVDALSSLGIEAVVLKGGLGKRARRAVRETLNDNKPGTVLLATISYLGEGFDWPGVDTLFFAFPVAWKGQVVQCVGRLLRMHDDKTDIVVHDYVDTLVPVLARMHEKRLTGYAKLGIDVDAARRRSRR